MSKIKIIGKHLPCERKLTSCYSLDRALINDEGDLGVTVGVGIELFGSNHVGKSTFAYSIAGILADNGIILADFEGYDPHFLVTVLETVNFEGKVNNLVEEGIKGYDYKKDEDMLGRMVKLLKTDNYQVGILDSIGAISPIAEQEGGLEEASMGRRAKIMAIFTRKATKAIKHTTPPPTFLAINHWYPRIGSRGYDTPGGEVKKFLLSVRILLKRKITFPDGSYLLEGIVYKNRWGFQDRNFRVFMLSGKGLHKGLTALWDATFFKKVDWEGDLRKAITVNGEKLGKLSTLVKEAKQGNNKIFEPFYEVLEDEKEEEDENAKLRE